MSETTFDATELALISLVLTQNADEYDPDTQEHIISTATKAREMGNEVNWE